MEEHLSIEQARPKLGDIVNRVDIAGEHFVITRNGKPVAVMVPVDWHEAARRQIEDGAQ